MGKKAADQLTEDHHREIKQLHGWGFTPPELAKMFKVTEGYIRFDILNEIRPEVSTASSRLSEEDIREMRKLKGYGVRLKDLAAKYDIKLSNVIDIVYYRTWKHVK